MSKNPYEESAFAKFTGGKLFYLLLALCLIGAGTSAALYMSKENEKAVPEVIPETVKKREEIPQIPVKPEIKLESGIEKINSEKPKEKNEDPKIPEKTKSVSVFSQSAVMPVKGQVISSFSNGELVKDETMGDWRTHNGTDISCSEGTEVVSFLSGVVKDVRSDALWGTVVEIEHPGALISKYCGLSDDVRFTKGDEVKMGEVIGRTGFIPVESSKAPHLHFEVKKAGKLIDPMKFVK